MPTKSFRGKLVDGGQERIRLGHIDGKTGYKVVKFQAVGVDLAGQAYEALLQIFKIEQTSVTASIDFGDHTLLGISYWGSHGDVKGYVESIIFDNEIFNQDIYITCKDSDGQPCNYYLELEQIQLDDVQATTAILKNFRNTNSYAT